MSTDRPVRVTRRSGWRSDRARYSGLHPGEQRFLGRIDMRQRHAAHVVALHEIDRAEIAKASRDEARYIVESRFVVE